MFGKFFIETLSVMILLSTLFLGCLATTAGNEDDEVIEVEPPASTIVITETP